MDRSQRGMDRCGHGMAESLSGAGRFRFGVSLRRAGMGECSSGMDQRRQGMDHPPRVRSSGTGTKSSQSTHGKQWTATQFIMRSMAYFATSHLDFMIFVALRHRIDATISPPHQGQLIQSLQTHDSRSIDNCLVRVSQTNHAPPQFHFQEC